MPAHARAALSFTGLSLSLALLLVSQLGQPRTFAWYTKLFVILAGEWISSTLVYRLALHPLAKYPGPLLAACTDWYTVYWISNGGRHLELHRQHKKHGKFVRYGPGRVSINSGAASRDLHDVAANTFKSTAYGSFRRFFGAEMSLTTVDHRAHAFRRRVNVTALTPAAVRALAPRVAAHVDYLVDLVAAGAGTDDGWGPGLDMAHLVAYCIADIMGDVTFGQHWDVQREPGRRHFVHDLPKGVAGIHLVGHMQSLFLFGLHRLLFRELIAGVGSLMDLSRSFARARLRRHDEALLRREAGEKGDRDKDKNKDDDEGDEGDEGHEGDIWAALLRARDPKTGRGFSPDELTSEASLFIIGGTDGMITAVTSTLFYLLHNPRTLARLTRELRDAFPQQQQPGPGAAEKDREKGQEEAGGRGRTTSCPIRFASPELQRVAYLPACIDEAMRLSPPVPSILPRRAGPGGLVVDGAFFPAGTDLGVPHYSLHRSEDVFERPLAYAPERWMPAAAEEEGVAAGDEEGDGTMRKKKKDLPGGGGALRPGVGHGPSFTPFGAGRSSCIGKHLAYQEMSFILARLIWLFDMRLDPDSRLGEGTGTGPEGRERRDEFQLYDRFVSQQEGPVVQFRFRADLAS